MTWSDFSASRDCVLVIGQSGSGKTTFALRYLVNRQDYVARFVWDSDGQIAARLRIPAATTPEECELALEDSWVVFDPAVSWSGRMADGFAWFCAWAYQASGRGPGRKVLMVDEVWRYCAPSSIPPSLAECVQTGRVRCLDTVFATQHPNRINQALTAECTELVSFSLSPGPAWDRAASLGAPQSVLSLAPGEFEAVNLRRRGRLRGRVF